MDTDRATDIEPDLETSELLARMQPRLRRFLGNLARHEVDDLVQETLARAWRSRRSLDVGLGNGEGWLLRIAFRAFLDHQRVRERVPAEFGQRPEATSGERDPFQQAAIREHTMALLGELSEREREVLLRFYRDGQSIEGIADALAMPRGTVKSHLHRARSRMWALEQARGDD